MGRTQMWDDTKKLALLKTYFLCAGKSAYDPQEIANNWLGSMPPPTARSIRDNLNALFRSAQDESSLKMAKREPEIGKAEDDIKLGRNQSTPDLKFRAKATRGTPKRTTTSHSNAKNTPRPTTPPSSGKKRKRAMDNESESSAPSSDDDRDDSATSAIPSKRVLPDRESRKSARVAYSIGTEQDGVLDDDAKDHESVAGDEEYRDDEK